MNTKQRELFIFGLSIGLAAGLMLGIGLRTLWARSGTEPRAEVVR